MPPAAMDAGGPPVHSVNPTVRVMALIIPGFLACSVGYVLYAVADYILIELFFHEFNYFGLAIGLLVTYAVLALLMVASYLRTFITIRTNPGVVPLGPEFARNFYGTKSTGRGGGRQRTGGNGAATCSDLLANAKSGGGRRQQGSLGRNGNKGNSSAKTALENGSIDLESGLAHSVPYDGGGGGGGAMGAGFGQTPAGPDPRLDPDSPGLELFYTKDVFECTADGRPVWCSQCGTWKPDRSHHCSEINRCVRKMDHYCPWVGGIVSETTFKFFLQFTFYATLFCALIIGTCAYALARRHALGLGTDGRIITALALASVLGLFAFAMAVTCLNFALTNLTTVESHQLKDRVKMMAVRIQRGAAPVEGYYNVVTYPLPKDEAPPVYGAVAPPPQLSHQQQAENGGAAEATDEPDPFKVAREARAARRAARDQLAFRTFAIVPVRKGMNVWDMGWRSNWTSVMGTNVLDWLLPFRLSPCCDHDSMQSFYGVSPEFQKLCASLNLPSCQEMEQVPRR